MSLGSRGFESLVLAKEGINDCLSVEEGKKSNVSHVNRPTSPSSNLTFIGIFETVFDSVAIQFHGFSLSLSSLFLLLLLASVHAVYKTQV